MFSYLWLTPHRNDAAAAFFSALFHSTAPMMSSDQFRSRRSTSHVPGPATASHRGKIPCAYVTSPHLAPAAGAGTSWGRGGGELGITWRADGLVMLASFSCPSRASVAAGSSRGQRLLLLALGHAAIYLVLQLFGDSHLPDPKCSVVIHDRTSLRFRHLIHDL